LQKNGAGLVGVTVESLPELACDAAALTKFGRGLRFADGDFADESNAAMLAGLVSGAALALLMINRGGTPQTTPGEPVFLVRETCRVQPFTVISDLTQGTLTRQSWQLICENFGLTGASLQEAVTLAGGEVPAPPSAAEKASESKVRQA
jgi:hypothetical protein